MGCLIEKIPNVIMIRSIIYRLSSSVRSLQIQPREDTPQGSGQREVGGCMCV